MIFEVCECTIVVQSYVCWIIIIVNDPFDLL